MLQQPTTNPMLAHPFSGDTPAKTAMLKWLHEEVNTRSELFLEKFRTQVLLYV
jgi:hypothetical protein